MPRPLTTVFRVLGHTEALKNGAVKPAHFDLDYVDVPVLIQAFRRMVRACEFDVCELGKRQDESGARPCAFAQQATSAS